MSMWGGWLWLGWRQWCAQPFRAAASSLVFAAVIALMLVFEGLRFGIIEDLRAFPASLPADYVIIEKNVGQFAVMASRLPQFSRLEAENVAGVAEVEPLTLAPLIFTHNGLKTPALVLAHEEGAWPRNLLVGRRVKQGHEVVVDSALASRHALRLGERIEILDYPLTVVGISDGTTSPFAPYMFMSYDDLIDLFLDADMSIGAEGFSLLSALLVRAQADVDMAGLRAALDDAVADGDVFTPAELGARDARFGWRLLGPVLLLTSSTAWLIGILVMGFLRFADVQAHRAEFGMQKALGADGRFLAVVLIVGALALVGSAFPLGWLGALGLATLIHTWNPLYSVVLGEPSVLGFGALATVLAAVLGSLIPLHGLLRLEPTVVFQR